MSNLEKLVFQARNFACSIYKNQPGALIPNPISDVLYLAWDEMCRPSTAPSGSTLPGLPSPPAPPYTGGQCVCVSYRITHIITWNDGTSWTNTNDVWGPVMGIYCKPGDPNNRCQPIVKCRGFTFQGGCVVAGDYGVSSFSNGSATGAAPTIRITSAVRLDGQPDNCGSPPKQFPGGGSVPSGGYTSSPVNVTVNNGDNITVNFNFTPPTAPAAPGLIPPIVVNYIKPELNLKIPIEFNFDGKVNVNLSPTVNLGDTVNKIDQSVTNINTSVNNVNSDIDNFYSQYKTDRDRDRNLPVAPADREVSPTQYPPGKRDTDRLAFVVVTLTSIPKNAKKQAASAGEEILYAGWLEFKQSGAHFERQPIHRSVSIFEAPAEATGYTFTLNKGYIGYATEIKNKAGT